MRRSSAAHGALIAIAATLCIAGPTVAGAPPDVEAGIFRDYVAPDAGAMTPGSITFGFLGSAEVIAPDAELVPPTDTNLPFLVGGAPTCLEVTRQGGEITRLAFVASCTVMGPVTLVPDVFGPGADAYMTSDRVVTPESVVLADPAINALMKTTADSGGVLTITFQVDLSFGAPTAFEATTSFDGAVTVLDTGDVQVDGALLLDAVIDPGSRTLLQRADAEELEATVTVQGDGLIDVSGKSQPAVTVALTVALTEPAVPSATPPPALLPDTSAGEPSSSPALAGLLALAVVALAIRGGRSERLMRRRGTSCVHEPVDAGG
jgi:hypothetical protein